MENILQINVNFGIAMTLKFYYIFQQLILQKKVDKILVSLDARILNHYRGENQTFYNNYILFFKYLNEFPEKLIIENEFNETYPNIQLDDLARKYGIPIQFKIYPKLLTNPIAIPYSYVTVSTKILGGVPKKVYNQFRDEFISRLNNLPVKIILLGERKVVECFEYTIHETYSIYTDLINNLKNYEDMTIEDNTINNELEPLLKTFSIFHQSKLNIFIGNGGVSELIPYSSTSILGLTFKDNLLNPQSYSDEWIVKMFELGHRIKVFNNPQPFLENLTL